MIKFKFLEHTADVKFQAFGKSLEEAFKNSALALKEVIYEKKVQEKKEKEIKVEEKDLESLLYSFLEEILFLLEGENFLISKIESLEISKDENKLKLKAIIFGDKSSNYKFTNPVKAITYNDMFVKKQNRDSATPIKWICQVVLDV